MVEPLIFRSAGNHRYGYNGQEKSDEIAGEGNHNTAEFWEYDTRSGRRWNLDPVDQVSISNYAAFANDPINKYDKDGDFVQALIGAVVGGGVEYASQVISNRSQGKSWGDSFKKVNVAKIAVATAVGAVTGGVGNVPFIAFVV